MQRLTSLNTIAVVGLLAGCAGNAGDPAPAPPSETSKTKVAAGDGDEPPAPPVIGVKAAPTAAEAAATIADIDANLEALRGLEVFEVRGVVLNIPEHANCYNLPCPGHDEEFVSIEVARAQAAPALAEFTSKAIAAASDETNYGACERTDEANLQALKDLRIVHLGDAILEEPQASNCYFERAIKLARIAQVFKKP